MAGIQILQALRKLWREYFEIFLGPLGSAYSTQTCAHFQVSPADLVSNILQFERASLSRDQEVCGNQHPFSEVNHTHAHDVLYKYYQLYEREKN